MPINAIFSCTVVGEDPVGQPAFYHCSCSSIPAPPSVSLSLCVPHGAVEVWGKPRVAAGMAHGSSAPGSAQCAQLHSLVWGNYTRSRKLRQAGITFLDPQDSTSLRKRSNCLIKHQGVEQNGKNYPDFPLEWSKPDACAWKRPGVPNSRARARALPWPMEGEGRDSVPVDSEPLSFNGHCRYASRGRVYHLSSS